MTGAIKAYEPFPFSGEYSRARRQLMLWSGVLFAWDLIGIDINLIKNDPGNVSTILKAILTPEAIPWVIIVLLGYFMYRLFIEWFHCSPMRRTMTVSRIDLGVSVSIALAASALHFFQLFEGKRLVNIILHPSDNAAVVLISIATFIVSSIITWLLFFANYYSEGKLLIRDRSLWHRISFCSIGIITSGGLYYFSYSALGSISPNTVLHVIAYIYVTLFCITPLIWGTGLWEWIEIERKKGQSITIQMKKK